MNRVQMILCASLIFAVGCGGGQPQPTVVNEAGEVVDVPAPEPPRPETDFPPKYNCGDVVALQSDTRRLIVIARQYKDDQWYYNCMYQEIHFWNFQKDLRLIEHFDWTIESPYTIPEVSADTFESKSP